ncbi:hypothetical protein [Nocardia sp. NPDC003979]
MPLAAGLFRRAIAQSVPGTFFAPELAAAISTTITAELGTRAAIEDLTAVSPGALVDATQAIIATMPQFLDVWGLVALTPTPFSPVIDPDHLPQAPWQALTNGAARGVDLLVGQHRIGRSVVSDASLMQDGFRRCSAYKHRRRPRSDTLLHPAPSAPGPPAERCIKRNSDCFEGKNLRGAGLPGPP